MRVVVGIDGSADAAATVSAAASRRWPDGTSALVVLVAEPGTDATAPATSAWLGSIVTSYAQRLRQSGLPTVPLVVAGDPTRQLVDEASRWEAGSIFVGARGLDAAGRPGTGRVAEAVLRNAACSVEIVRAPAGPARGD